MAESTPHYCVLLDINQTAFAENHYFVAYHALIAAMYCAVGTRDVAQMREVLFIGSGQLEELTERLGDAAFPNETVELGLYRSLVPMIRTRLLLLERH